MPYEIDWTDLSIANNKWLPQQEKAIRIMAWFNANDWEVLEMAINSSGSTKTVSWPWWNGIDSDLTNTVWGTPKASLDLSLFHW